jgi:hypothetical protein
MAFLAASWSRGGGILGGDSGIVEGLLLGGEVRLVLITRRRRGRVGEEGGVSAAALAWCGCGRFGGGIVAAEGVVPVEHSIVPGSKISN